MPSVVEDCEAEMAHAPDRSEVSPAMQKAPFPRKARLLKHSDFERVYKQGRRHFSPHMTVFYLLRASSVLPSSEVARSNARGAEAKEKREGELIADGSRVGFTVGRVLGGAVQRNRIKRRLREAVRLQRSGLKQTVDVVINPKKSILTLEFAVALEEVRRAFEAIEKKLAVG